MIQRRWLTLTAVTLASAFATASALALAPAQDPRSETPLGKLMEKVQDHNAKILKGVRSAPNYKKSQEEVVASARELIQLAKDSTPFTEPAKENKQPQEKWEKLCKEFEDASKTFMEKVEKKETTQAEAKNAYKAVQKTCTDCHDVFRKDED